MVGFESNRNQLFVLPLWRIRARFLNQRRTHDLCINTNVNLIVWCKRSLCDRRRHATGIAHRDSRLRSITRKETGCRGATSKRISRQREKEREKEREIVSPWRWQAIVSRVPSQEICRNEIVFVPSASTRVYTTVSCKIDRRRKYARLTYTMKSSESRGRCPSFRKVNYSATLEYYSYDVDCRCSRCPRPSLPHTFSPEILFPRECLVSREPFLFPCELL